MHDDDLRLAPAHSIFECHPTDVHPCTRRDQSDDNEQRECRLAVPVAGRLYQQIAPRVSIGPRSALALLPGCEHAGEVGESLVRSCR